jgi:hypothetical protein
MHLNRYQYLLEAEDHRGHAETDVMYRLRGDRLQGVASAAPTPEYSYFEGQPSDGDLATCT